MYRVNRNDALSIDFKLQKAFTIYLVRAFFMLNIFTLATHNKPTKPLQEKHQEQG